MTDRQKRRLALVDSELDKYQDMVAFSDTRLADIEEAAEAYYTLVWSGYASNREAGVGLAIKT